MIRTPLYKLVQVQSSSVQRVINLLFVLSDSWKTILEDITMRLVSVPLFTILVGCFAARLENTYLPPGNAGSAGGAGLIAGPRPPAGSGSRPGPRPGAGAGGFGTGPGHSGAPPPGVLVDPVPPLGRRPGAGGGGGQEVPIVSFTNENNGDGNYAFSYETGNGITAQETGQAQGDAEAVSGSYSYTGPDGVQYTITYTADAEGFHPQGAHIPTPPPIPPEIQRGVDLALAAEARGENQDGGGSQRGGQTSANTGGGYSQGGGHGGGFGRGQGGFGGFGGGRGTGGAASGIGSAGAGTSAYQGPNSYQAGSHPGYQY